VNRARTSIIAVVLLAAAALCAGSVGARSAASASPQRPNIVVLMTDDQTVESLRVMPNVKRLLVDRGAYFENSFVSFSLCCPSRATFLTGQYAHNHGVLSNQPPFGGYARLDGSRTLPVWLERAGYSTILLGKYLNGYGKRNPTEIPPGWTEWHGSVDPSTYNYVRYTLNENGTLVKYGADKASYQTDVYADKAVEIVRRRAAADRPFFLWVAFLAPHSGGPQSSDRPPDTALPAPRDRGRFAAEPLPRPPSFNEADVSDKPGGIRIRPRLDTRAVRVVTKRYQLRLESLLAVDDAVGRIVDELDRSGELDNTLIVFTSDNGFLQGEHRIPLGKVSVYEPSTRVPLIMRGPGIRAGLRLRQPVANIDLAPTIVEAAGARAGLRMDGESLWPILRDPGLFWGRDVLHEGPGDGPTALQFIALRTPQWIYARYFSGAEELYDLGRDPDELTNLRADPAAAGVRNELRARLRALEVCLGESCRRGPELALTLDVEGSCPNAEATIDITGADASKIVRVRFLVGRKVVETVSSAPFTLAEPLSSAWLKLRAHVVLDDGRELTEDRVLPACRTGVPGKPS
jgi:N-acetylglucosamine-6-sulfatase